MGVLKVTPLHNTHTVHIQTHYTTCTYTLYIPIAGDGKLPFMRVTLSLKAFFKSMKKWFATHVTAHCVYWTCIFPKTQVHVRI